MVRILAALIVLPSLAVLAWLAARGHDVRADFVFAMDEPRTIDPHRVSWTEEIQLSTALFEGLARPNARTFRPEPAVAASWSQSREGLTWTFHLRPDARWSNGAPLVAEDFRWSWLRVLDPATAAQYAQLLFVLEGAEAYYRSRLDDDSSNDVDAARVGIDVPDAHTLRVRLAMPCAYFLELVAFVTWAPVHRATLERAGARGQRWMRPANIVCNGPFVLREWSFKERIVLERNRHYWDASNVGVDTMEAFITPDPNVALLAYETGRVDLVRYVSTDIARALMQQQRSDFHIGDRFATYFLRVNCRRPPLDDPVVRQALSLAIDRDAICAHVMGLGQSPAFTYVPRSACRQMPRKDNAGNVIYYEPPTGLGADLPYDERVVLARQLLATTAYGRDPNRRPLELAYPPIPDQAKISEAVQGMWESALDLRVELRVQEATVLSGRIRALDYDLVRSNWYGDYMDPMTFLGMFTTDDGQNRTGWSDPRYDALIAQAAREADNTRRFAQFREAERILCEREIPIIPLFFRRGNFLLRSEFTNLHDNPRDVIYQHYVQRRE